MMKLYRSIYSRKAKRSAGFTLVCGGGVCRGRAKGVSIYDKQTKQEKLCDGNQGSSAMQIAKKGVGEG